MDVDKWKKVKPILEELLEILPESRSEFLKNSCNGDKDLELELERLIELEQSASDLLEQEAVSVVLGDHLSAKNLLGEKIGNYKIIDELGAGGMGTVYLAERADGAFEQKVALKIIKRGMNTDAVLRRFFNERQILASLEHPNIAHLIDGGSTQDDLPYIVMEYVKGENIIEFARNKKLDCEARLDLFREVCAAVSFAHQKLIIHRDLKPSNVLVTKDGKAKLLDFGIAKLQKPDNLNVTRTQQFAFTPEYASPEQIRGENLSTATDIYSLGIILYELLSGSRPFDFENKNIGEIIKTATQSEPIAPSAAISSKSKVQSSTSENKEEPNNPKSKIQNLKLKGDLDNIILKALKKEPERRYSTVEQFSEDIRRHLKGLPVFARQDTWSYRAEKFMRRNPFVVGAVALAFLILIGGITATAYQARNANIERQKAERRFNDVRTLANSFMFEINEEITKSPIRARELLVQRALEYLDKLASEAADDITLQSELATAYEKIGDVQTEAFKPNLGKTSDALSSHQKALSLREKLFAAEPTAIRGVDVANSHLRIGDIFMMSGQIAETRENCRRAIQILEPLQVSDPTNFAVRRKLGSSYARLGQAVLRSGSLNESLTNYEKSLILFETLRDENPGKSDLERGVGIVFSYIGFVKMEMGKSAEAVQYYGRWLDIEKKLADTDKNDLGSRNNLSTANTWFGIALNEQSKSDEAIFYLTEGVKIQVEIFREDKKDFSEQVSLADAYLELGKVQVKQNRPNEAIKMLENALEFYQATWQTDRESLFARHRIASTQRYLADAFLQKGDSNHALENYRQSLDAFQELTAADPNSSDWQHDLAMTYLRLGEFYRETKDEKAAFTNFEKSLPIFKKLSANSPENAKRKKDLQQAQELLLKSD